MFISAKDWNKIHQLHWSKMDSIDEYLAKKRKRTETMTQSVKKLRMLTEQIRSNIQHVKKSNTPSAMTKEVNLEFGKTNILALQLQVTVG